MTTYTATYSPEDNKLRLYASQRLDADTYARVRAAGFKWAPMQKLFVAPAWSPDREDLLCELAGEIEAEEMTLAERAAMKAERLDNLAAKRFQQSNAYARRADELASNFANGQPILIGHHSERRARKDQERMQSASAQSEKARRAANYWLYRASGVEHFANMKNCERTRRNRIKALLAELRDLQRSINQAHRALATWEKVTDDAAIIHALGWTDSRELCAPHMMTYAIQKGELTPSEARAQCIANAELQVNGPKRRRWIEHTLQRLGYERAMLGEVARYDGELTPVILQAFAREHGADKPKVTATDPGFFQLESPTPLPAHLASGAWLELGDEDWRDLMQSTGYEVPDAKPRRASSKPAPLPLVNLSQEQAEQLQRIWNARSEASGNAHAKANGRVRSVIAMTQATYSARSKGSYAPCQTVDIDATGARVRGFWRNMVWTLSGEAVARVRICTAGGWLYGPDAVVFITDKPTKALPFDLDALERELTGAQSQNVAA